LQKDNLKIIILFAFTVALSLVRVTLRREFVFLSHVPLKKCCKLATRYRDTPNFDSDSVTTYKMLLTIF
jgi:hypothetical protein